MVKGANFWKPRKITQILWLLSQLYLSKNYPQKIKYQKKINRRTAVKIKMIVVGVSKFGGNCTISLYSFWIRGFRLGNQQRVEILVENKSKKDSRLGRESKSDFSKVILKRYWVKKSMWGWVVVSGCGNNEKFSKEGKWLSYLSFTNFSNIIVTLMYFCSEQESE